MEEGGDGRRGHGGRGKPGVEGKESRLGPQADKGEDEGDSEQGIIQGGGMGQPAAGEEIHTGTMAGEQQHAGKGQGSAGEGINQIAAAGPDGEIIPKMSDQGQGGQGQTLIADIEGKEIGRQGHAQGGGIAEGIPGKEGVFPARVGHIFQGIEYGQGPEKGQEAGEDTAEAVHPEGKGKEIREGEEGQDAIGGRQAQPEGQQGNGQSDGLRIQPAEQAAPETEEGEQQSAQERDQEKSGHE